MSSKGVSPRISHPYKLQPRKAKATPNTNTKAAPVAPAIRPKRVHWEEPAQDKAKPSAGRRVLNFLKKTVPCTSSAKYHVEEPVDDYSDVIEISSRVKRELESKESSTALPLPAVPKVQGTERDQTCSSPKLILSTPPTVTPPRSSVQNLKGDSAKQPSPRAIAQANTSTLRANVSPPKPSPRVTTSAKVASRATQSTVASRAKQVEASSSPRVEVTVRRTINAKAPVSASTLSKPLVRTIPCNYQRQRPRQCSSVCKYDIRNGGADVKFTKRKRFIKYTYFHTFSALVEVDEPLEDVSSPSTPSSDIDSWSMVTRESESEPVLSPSSGDSPIVIEKLECSEVLILSTANNNEPGPSRTHRYSKSDLDSVLDDYFNSESRASINGNSDASGRLSLLDVDFDFGETLAEAFKKLCDSDSDSDFVFPESDSESDSEFVPPSPTVPLIF